MRRGGAATSENRALCREDIEGVLPLDSWTFSSLAFGTSRRSSAATLPTPAHLGLGRLYRRTGKPEQAKEHLTTVAAMYGEMGIAYWLEKLEKDI